MLLVQFHSANKLPEENPVIIFFKKLYILYFHYFKKFIINDFLSYI
jgi:hypothetical protein